MRCTDCGKFVSFGEPEVEVLESGVSDDGDEVTAEVQVALPCAECGQTLREGALEAAEQVDHDCDLAAVVSHQLKTTPRERLGTDDVDRAVADREIEVVECSAIPVENSGKPSTYGASVLWQFSCSACGAVIETSTDVVEPASYYEEA